eukprot:7381149-Prymnesium_polylepis.2
MAFLLDKRSPGSAGYQSMCSLPARLCTLPFKPHSCALRSFACCAALEESLSGCPPRERPQRHQQPHQPPWMVAGRAPRRPSKPPSTATSDQARLSSEKAKDAAIK